MVLQSVERKKKKGVSFVFSLGSSHGGTVGGRVRDPTGGEFYD